MTGKRFMLIIAAMAMVFTLAACGGASKEAAAGEAATISTADQQEVLNQMAKDASAVPVPDTKAVEAATTTGATDSAPGGAIDKLLGKWEDINDAAKVVTITSNGDGYQYEDSDGTYSGTLKDGVLTIKISDAQNDTATVFIDSKTHNLVTNYQGDIYEFSRKGLQ